MVITLIDLVGALGVLCGLVVMVLALYLRSLSISTSQRNAAFAIFSIGGGLTYFSSIALLLF